MTTEIYNSLQLEDFPMVVKQTGVLYERKEFIAKWKSDFHPFGYANIEIVKKKQRLKISMGKNKNWVE